MHAVLSSQSFSLPANTIDDRKLYLYVVDMYLKAQKPELTRGKLLIEQDRVTTANFPDSLQGYDISLVFLEKPLFKKLGNSLSILRIVPLRFYQGRFKVAIIEFWVTYKKNNILLENRGGMEFKFELDCETQSLISVENERF